MTPPPSKEALERAVEALKREARLLHKAATTMAGCEDMHEKADKARAAAKEIQDYLDGKEGEV